MELNQLIKLFSVNKKKLGMFGFVGLLTGLILYYMPAKHLASGSFFVKRAVDTNVSFFTYEGYYASQSALSFTNTVVALLESEDVQSASLASLGLEINENSLYKLDKSIKVKKSAPQLITLTVKGNTPEEATKLWNSLAQELIKTAAKVTASGDNRLGLAMVSDNPVVKKPYRSLYIYLPAGILSGLALGMFLVFSKEYE